MMDASVLKYRFADEAVVMWVASDASDDEVPHSLMGRFLRSSEWQARMVSTAMPKGLRLHPRFCSAMHGLPGSTMQQLSRLLDQLTGNFEALRQLKGCKEIQGIPGGKVFECRVNGGYRLSFMMVAGGVPYLLLVGHHDHLVDDTKRLVKAGVDVPQDEPPSIDLAYSTSTYDPRSRREYSPTVKSPLNGVSDDLLVQMTVPKSLIPAVRGLSDPDDVIRVGGLPESARDALLAYFVEGIIQIPGISKDLSATETVIAINREARERHQRLAGKQPSAVGLSREFLLEIGVKEELLPALLTASSWQAIEELPLPLKVAQRLMEAVAVRDVTGMEPGIEADRVAADVDELERYYRGDLTELLLQVTDEQRPILDLRTDQLHLLKGVAGSGKTTLAVYRARRVAVEAPRAKVLFVTFTKALAASARELVAAITGPEDRKRIEVTHLHQWMSDYLGADRPTVVGDSKRIELMRTILQRFQEGGLIKSRILSRPPEWFKAEISESIKGRGLESLEQYLSLERTGRETALPEAARRAVWLVYEAYAKALGTGADWDDLPIRTLAKLAADPARPVYDFVVVDEAQDLSPAALKLIAALARKEQPAGMVVADAAQSIYRRGFRWKDTGLVVRGSQVHRLTNNHRNTMQILAAANALLAGRPELRDDGDGILTDLNAPRLGPKPRLVLRDRFKQETAVIASDVLRMRREKGLRWGNVAVLAPTHHRLNYLAWALGEAAIPVVKQGSPEFNLQADAVKLLTVHSAKGLEFPVVYVCDCSASVFPRVPEGEEDPGEVEDAGRRLLYVAMTRAMHELILTGSSSKPSPFLRDLPGTLLTTESSPVGVVA